MEGFVVFDYWSRYGEAEAELAGWYEAGTLQVGEDIVDGLENMPEALAGLFAGTNRGIRLCRVAPDPD